MSIIFPFLYVYSGTLKEQSSIRVWKAIPGTRDLTHIKCGIRENEKCLDAIRDFTAIPEAGSWHGMLYWERKRY